MLSHIGYIWPVRNHQIYLGLFPAYGNGTTRTARIRAIVLHYNYLQIQNDYLEILDYWETTNLSILGWTNYSNLCQ